jgi:hypothetical protein
MMIGRTTRELAVRSHALVIPARPGIHRVSETSLMPAFVGIQEVGYVVGNATSL